MDPTIFLVQCLNAVQYGLLLFLIASGLTLIFGILGVINLAHGALYMVGAYLIYALTPVAATYWGGNFAVTVVVGMLLALAFGYLLEWLFFSFLYGRDHLQQVLMTYGLIIVLEELRGLAFGNDVHSVPVPQALAGPVSIAGVIDYPLYRLVVMAVCVAFSLGLYILIQKTRLGMRIRAGADNRDMTRALGIDVPGLFRIVFAMGVMLAAVAGMLDAPSSSVFPGMGNGVLIISFVVVVIGGIGSVLGAFIAALLVGFTDTFGKVFLPDFASVGVYLLMTVVLLWKPTGLLGGAR
ncbi:branched-chain amino acid ABC transporter permease [Pigmentiphaga sp. H8]|uniref:branched-chain amino acid ABC transporter permease n=1 Tax=Pigmentiphaga sp. H8 TaxID=2488560 RepID=UPI000F5920B9|nr:branched-chain amino acid ABC transporter permease [Pigmentiphaga sp. H8]AZG08309.1 branched-chain amino acid ABC transporter permease [Pigmentiphaga sp. H8]